MELGDLASEVGHERVRLGGVVRRRVVPDEVQLDGERLREEGRESGCREDRKKVELGGRTSRDRLQ